jgi:lipoprotein signal peptidase
MRQLNRNGFINKHKVILISFIMMTVDFLIKTWAFNHLRLGQQIDIIDGFLILCRVESVGTIGFRFYVLLLILLCFLFFIVRVIKIETYWYFKLGIAFTFFGLVGNYYDTIAFGMISGDFDFIPNKHLFSGFSFRYIESFGFNLGFEWIVMSISTIMTNVGFITFVLVSIFHFPELKRIIGVRNSQ